MLGDVAAVEPGALGVLNDLDDPFIGFTCGNAAPGHLIKDAELHPVRPPGPSHSPTEGGVGL